MRISAPHLVLFLQTVARGKSFQKEKKENTSVLFRVRIYLFYAMVARVPSPWCTLDPGRVPRLMNIKCEVEPAIVVTLKSSEHHVSRANLHFLIAPALRNSSFFFWQAKVQVQGVMSEGLSAASSSLYGKDASVPGVWPARVRKLRGRAACTVCTTS